MKEKTYTCAPLPFMGQKRRFLKQFKHALNSDFKNQELFIDLFDGSGLLSHTTKRLRPFARVIYNDFDNYSTRIENIPETNKILAELRELLLGYTNEKLLTAGLKQQVLQIIKKYDEICLLKKRHKNKYEQEGEIFFPSYLYEVIIYINGI